MPEWDSPKSLLTGGGRQLCSEPSRSIHDMMGIRKLIMTAYRAMSNGSLNQVDHSNAQILLLVVNARQYGEGKHLPLVILSV